MNTGSAQAASNSPSTQFLPAAQLFRARFQSSLRRCLRRRFSAAECFGVIWLETLEEIPLDDEEQAMLYDELIGWAKHQLFLEITSAPLPCLDQTH